MCMNILFSYMLVHLMCTLCLMMSVLDPLELELQTVVNCLVGASN